jgi:glycosyltransferase involved in cell wall biosynthesis
MDIVFLLHDIHFGGGGERVTVHLADQLIRKGYQVTIVSLSKYRKENIYTINPEIHIEYLNFDFQNKINLIEKTISVFAVRKYFKPIKKQTIVLGTGTYPSLLLALLPHRKNIKSIGCQHNSYAAVKHFWAISRKLFFGRLNALVSLTNQDLPKLKRINPNSYVIPNAVPFYPEKPAKLENKIILSVGRIEYLKGYDLLLDAFEKVNINLLDWKLRIIGDGPLKNYIRERLIASGLNEKVEILPPTAKIIDEYMQASVYVMTSRTEGLPMVLLEAQACGLPIVSFDCETGPSDIVSDNENGFLIKRFDTDSMAQKLSLLCTDLVKRKEFGVKGRENVKKYFTDEIINKWEVLFEKLYMNV